MYLFCVFGDGYFDGRLLYLMVFVPPLLKEILDRKMDFKTLQGNFVGSFGFAR